MLKFFLVHNDVPYNKLEKISEFCPVCCERNKLWQSGTTYKEIHKKIEKNCVHSRKKEGVAILSYHGLKITPIYITPISHIRQTIPVLYIKRLIFKKEK